MTKTIFAGLAALALGACATVAANSIESDLKELGLSDRRADCLAEQLKSRLTGEQIGRLAVHMDSLTRAETGQAAFRAVAGIDDPGIAAGVAQSGIACSLTR